MTENRATLKGYFNTGDKPTSTQLASMIDSLAHTDELNFIYSRLNAFAVNNTGSVYTAINNGSGEADTAWTVDGTTGFLDGAEITYSVAGIPYSNTIVTVDSSTQITVGTTPPVTLPDNTVIAMVPPGVAAVVGMQIFNVKDFGATGDGTTDDYAALQATIDAVPASGGIVYFPPSTNPYLHGTQLNVTSPMTFLGNDAWLKASSSLTGSETGNILVDATSYVTFIRLNFDGLYPTRTSGTNIRLRDSTDIRVLNCRFERSAWAGVAIARCERVWIQNCSFDTIYKTGVSVSGATISTSMRNRWIWIDNNDFRRTGLFPGDGQGAIAIVGGLNAINEYISITNNKVHEHNNICFALDTISKSIVEGNIIDRFNTSLVNDAYVWSNSGTTPGEWYIRIASNENPSFRDPTAVYENGAAMSSGSLGSLAEGEYAFGNQDSLGGGSPYDTLYIRLTGDLDPNAQVDDYVTMDQGMRSGEGIAFTGSFNKIINNYIRGQGTGIIAYLGTFTNFEHIQIIGNTCIDSANHLGVGNGISVATAGSGSIALSHLLIALNTCRDNATMGIQTYNNASPTVTFANNMIIGNILADNGGTNLSVLGSHASGFSEVMNFVDGGLQMGANNAPKRLYIKDDVTLTGNVTDSFTAGLRLTPAHTVTDGGNHTITRLNYIDLNTPTETETSGTITITNADVFRFDAAAGTHPAVDGSSTKTTPSAVDAWLKVNLNGTTYFMPIYASKTT